MQEPLTEHQVVRALQRLSRRWPEDMYLFAQSGTLCLMRAPETDPMYYEDCIADFTGIKCDGGDVDWSHRDE